MPPIRPLLTLPRMLAVAGVAALIVVAIVGAEALPIALQWSARVVAFLLVLWLLARAWQHRRAQQGASALDGLLAQPEVVHRRDRGDAARVDNEALRRRMHEAVKTIKGSRLGQVSGRAALYELPWYITIGNPAAGKSSAIINSGLKFPFEDGAGSAVQGVGGTRNCDWFFTTEGILLDTAGRYSVHEDEDRQEWRFFLAQLRKLRPLAPINGIIITASVADLSADSPETVIALARNLRQRVQELTEALGVFAPTYVMFTKADLVAGFSAFFADLDDNERDRAWGATLPCDCEGGTDAVAVFDRHFDTLYEGLRELGVAQMARAVGAPLQPGLLAFPLEFAALKPKLRVFIATLFEGNPFQFEPVFRGFYFTSARQGKDTPSTAHARVEARFAISGNEPTPATIGATHGYFLRHLFAKVIFADKHLVRQYACQGDTRKRRAAVLASMALLGTLLGGWSWSHANNRALAADVRADLDHIIRLQDGRDDLQSRLAALEVVQERIVQLDRFDTDRPLALGLGLYQGDALKAKLAAEYERGIRSLLLEPVREHLEAFLAAVNEHASELGQHTDRNPPAPPTHGPLPYVAADPAQTEDAYNALKTYLMLATGDHLEPGHLSDQLTRMWRGWLEANRAAMPRADMIRSAERILSFHVARAGQPEWPLIEYNPALVEQTRATLRTVVHGAPAINRVYADIKARASTRFAPVTVAALAGPDHDQLIAGSHVIAGAFTREAWDGYVRQAIRDAASGELQSTDWVLKHATREDLTLQGSPQQIEQSLTALYEEDYAREWQRFVQGVAVTSFDSFPAAVSAMDRLGDPQRSPIGTLLRTIAVHTSANHPVASTAGTARRGAGFIAWFRQSVLRMAPAAETATTTATRPALTTDVPTDAAPTGSVGNAFSAINRLLTARDDGLPLAERYLQQLGAIRSRLNQIAHQGDSGPGAVKLMQATLDGTASELADTLRFVDEQMLVGVPETQRNMLRPLLLRPLQQTFAAVVLAAEHELNRLWQAQVYEPFRRRLVVKYPFAPEAVIEATPAEIARIFGPDGAIAHYVDHSMGTLVVRRGQTIAPRTWGELGLRLQPAFVTGFARWVGPLDGAAAAATTADPPQTTFMLMPHPTVGSTGYTIEIDGQRLHYGNGAAQWATFVWPNPGATAGARIVLSGLDGNTVEIANFAGRFGLEKLINTAARTRSPDGSFVLTWGTDEFPVRVGLRIISSSQAQVANEHSPRQSIGGSLPATVAGTPAEPTDDALRGGAATVAGIR